jgi:hypothetical protein
MKITKGLNAASASDFVLGILALFGALSGGALTPTRHRAA